MLGEFERDRIVQALRVWLDRHPEPDAPAFQIAQEPRSLSPRQLVDSVGENDRLGQQILAILEYSIRRTSLEEVADDLEHSDTEPPPTTAIGEPVGA
jgi:hypothetical protein